MLYNYLMSNPKPNVPDNKGKELNVKPTLRQKQAFTEMVGNGGNKAKALREVGYSPAVVNNPQKVTESKGWKQLEEEYFPLDQIAEVQAIVLKAKRYIYLDEEYEHEIKSKDGNVIGTETRIRKVQTEVDDIQNLIKALDIAYKVRGMYPKEQKGDLNINVFSLADLAERHNKRKQLGFVDVEEAKVIEEPKINK